MNIIVVLPTYNERDTIEKIIDAICSRAHVLTSSTIGVIVVDDHSPDGTGDIVKELQEEYPVYLHTRNKKMGIGSAYVVGFKKALALGADVIFEMDADFSHDPNDIPRLISALAHADVAIGSRRVPGGKIAGWGARRRFTSWAATIFSRTLLRLRTRDVTAGFRAFHQSALASIDLSGIRSSGYAFQEELLYRVERAGLKIAEVPVIFTDRKKGRSKLGWREIKDFFASVLTLWLRERLTKRSRYDRVKNVSKEEKR